MTRNPTPLAEPLERRLLLSAVNRRGSTLRVFGDTGVDNVITVGLDATRKNINVTVNGVTQTLSRSGLRRVNLYGDSGNDTISIDTSAATFDILTNIFAGAGDDRIRCKDEKDYVEGGDGNDRISLGGGRNFAFGQAGDDIIDGGDQRDFISGGAGADLLNGGGDRDQLQGDNGSDTINGDDGSDLIFAGRGDDSVDGGGSKDVIFGQDGNDTLFGGTDKDELFGQAGDDTLDGGEDRNTLWGGAGNDTLTNTGGSGTRHPGELQDIDKFVREIIPTLS
jgi:Ca2+-binding RTX toxin-like protein